MLEPCSNVDCTSRATETAFILAHGLEVSVRVCARDAAVIGSARRSLRATQELVTEPRRLPSWTPSFGSESGQAMLVQYPKRHLQALPSSET